MLWADLWLTCRRDRQPRVWRAAERQRSMVVNNKENEHVASLAVRWPLHWLLWASRQYTHRHSVRDWPTQIIQSKPVHTAVCTTLESSSSIFPPGSAVSPGWNLSVLDRVVRSTRSSPASSNRRTNTAASLVRGYADLQERLFVWDFCNMR
jgi:hypothetical protein